MENSMAVISLLFLVAVLVLGFTKKINMGLLSIGAALILAHISGIPEKEVISNFNTSLFVTLVGSGFLFAIAVSNGTMELFAKKMLSLAGKRSWLIPILYAVLAFLVSAAGPGNIAPAALFGPLGLVLGIELGIDPIALGLLGALGCNMGCMSAVANGGIIAANLGAESGYAGQYETKLFLYCMMIFVIVTALFIFVFKLYKAKASDVSALKDLPKFNRNQILTLSACGILIVTVFLTKWNVGLLSVVLGIILILLKVADDKAALKIMPWGTFIMVCGVSVLMKMVVSLGGISMMTDGLISIMSKNTAAPLMGLAAGVLSWFSSTTGVVMPTLIPTIPGIIENFGTVGYAELIAAITITSFLAAFSPASTGGGTTLAQYAIFNPNASGDELNKQFMRMFFISVACVLLSVFLALIGFYKILG